MPKKNATSAQNMGAQVRGGQDRFGLDAIVPSDAQSEAFVKGLVDNGQAAKPAPDGTLPPGATHEIIGETPTGLPVLRRKRFSAY